MLQDQVACTYLIGKIFDEDQFVKTVGSFVFDFIDNIQQNFYFLLQNIKTISLEN